MSDPTSHYNTVTDSWSQLLGEDLHYGYFSSPNVELQQATRAMTRQLASAAGLQSGWSVLDVGCGTGKPACDLVKEYHCRLVGVSPSQVCIDRANARAQSLDLVGRVDFLRGDGMQLAFADCSFDCVWVMESSHLMPDKPALLAECQRVLKPGGRLVLCDIVAKRNLEIADVIEFRDQFLLLQAAFGRARMEPLSVYCEQLQHLGYVGICADDISQQTRATFALWRRNALAHRESVAKLLGEQAWSEFLESCSVLEQLWDLDVLGYGLVTATKAPIS